MDLNNQPANLSSTPPPRPEGRAFFVVLIFICLVSLGWGGWQLSQKIKAPFPVASNTNTNLNEELAQIVSLQKQDTDKDGLSDYDELYVYQTSPYLADSDSDGFTDKEEIVSGHDPNCPATQNCDWTPFSQNQQTGANVDNGLAASDTSNLLQGAATPAQVRQALLAAGMSADELSQLDDASLMEVYNQALTQAGATGGQTSTGANANASTNASAGASTNTALTAEQIEYLNSLSPAEIRDMLKQAGMTESDLSKIDDATLKEMLRQTLTEQAAK